MKMVITGGHHSSALPVIKEIQENHKDISIYWFGHRHSLKGNKSDTLEYIQITSLGIPFYDLKAGKFYKTYNLARLAKIPFGFFQALILLLKIKPAVILSFGGYLAVPTVLAGWLLGIPSVTHEQTVVVGYANKLISKFSKKVLVSWEESKKYFDPSKVIYVGLPLREEVFKSSSNSFSTNNTLPTIYVTAGKTGSHKINMVIKDAMPILLKKFNVIHQCGDHSEFEDYETLINTFNELKPAVLGNYFCRKFVLDDEIGEAFARSSLVISRSGAHIVKELYTMRKPCLLIPIPWVSHNEQYKNAELLKHLGIAEILEEKDLSSESLVATIISMVERLDTYVTSLPVDVASDQNSPQELIIQGTLSCLKPRI